MNGRAVFSSGLLFLHLAAFAQQEVDPVAAALRGRRPDRPTELLYFQCSKGIYETGEDLWFKAYQLDRHSLGLSDASRTLYLRIVDSRDSVVWQRKYPIGQGIAEGHAYLDEKLPAGDYFLKGYTRGAVFGDDSLGQIPMRKIRVVERIAEAPDRVADRDSALRFETFPEGGHLVAGIPSRLAFKATDGRGVPVEVAGTLYEADEPLCAIRSEHDGMGSVWIRPVHGRAYEVRLNDGRRYPLSGIRDEGVTLRLSHRTDRELGFGISRSAGLPDRPVYLVGRMRGRVCCIARGLLKENLEMKIPLEHFPYQGIAEFTLLDHAMRPLCERLVYLHPERKLHIRLEPDKTRYGTREEATIRIRVTDSCGNPVRAHLGLSVYDCAYDNAEDAVDIDSYCYLASQIRGRIHNPAYYFDERNDDRAEALDLLLLTQGWRDYVWELRASVHGGRPFLTDELTGIQTVRDKNKGDAEQLIRISGADGRSSYVWTDSLGRFSVGPELLETLRGGYIYLKPMLSEKFRPKIDADDPFLAIDSLPGARAAWYPFVGLRGTQRDGALDGPVVSPDSSILVEGVAVVAQGDRMRRDKFMGRLDSLAEMSMGGAWVCTCPPGYLNDYLPGYTHHIYHTQTYNGERLRPKRGKHYRMIKYEARDGGVFVADTKEITYEGPAYSDEELLAMNGILRVEGYYGERRFYRPDSVDMLSSLPDARNTLLWDPAVVTDQRGEAEVRFVCSDLPTSFAAVAEGVDGAGLLGRGRCGFRVVRSKRR